jgi:hypothetical protein
MRAALWRRAVSARRTASVVPHPRPEARMRRTRSAEPRTKCVSLNREASLGSVRLSHRNRVRAIVTARNLAPTDLTPELPVSKKSFANALDERILPNQAVAGKRAVAVGSGLNMEIRCALEYRAVSTDHILIAALASRADNLRHGVAA